MMKKRREPGGGRKPTGPFKGKSATLSTRITPDTRALLDQQAKARGTSLSQEVEYCLREYLTKSNATPPHIRALADTVVALATKIEQRTGKEWHSDAFTSDALRHAIEAVVLHHTASEERTAMPARLAAYAARLPASLRPSIADPASFGRLEAEGLIYAIENAPLSSVEALGLAFPAPSGLSRIRSELSGKIPRNPSPKSKDQQR